MINISLDKHIKEASLWISKKTILKLVMIRNYRSWMKITQKMSFKMAYNKAFSNNQPHKTAKISTVELVVLVNLSRCKTKTNLSRIRTSKI